MQTLTQSQATALIKAIQVQLEGGLFTKLDFEDVIEEGLTVNVEFRDIDGTIGAIRTWFWIPIIEGAFDYSRYECIRHNTDRVCEAVHNAREDAERAPLTVHDVIDLTLAVVRLTEMFEKPLEKYRSQDRPPSDDWLIDPTQWS